MRTNQPREIQLDWLDHAGTGLPLRTVGNIIRTSYERVPTVAYRIIEVNACDGDGGYCYPEPHFDLVCELAIPPQGQKNGPYWLNGYRADGSCVWSDDRIELVEQQEVA